MLNCKKLQYARISCILLLTASMFDWKFTINNLDSDGRDHMQYTNDAEKDIYIVYDLGDRKWMLKMCVSALKSAGWDLLKFQQVRSIDPNTIGDNGLGQWRHHQGRPAPLQKVESHSARW